MKLIILIVLIGIAPSLSRAWLSSDIISN